MKKPILPLSQCALLVFCLMAGTAYAQPINFSGGTLPTGNLGPGLSTKIVIVGEQSYGTLALSEGPADAVVNMNEGTAVEIGRRIILPGSSSPKARGTGTIKIEGSTNPGSIQVQDFQFGQSQLGVINFKHTDASGDYVFAPNLLGPGAVNINRAGTTNFAGINTYEGTTSVKAGMLRAASLGGLSPSSDFVLASIATVDTGVRSRKVKSLSNAGTVTLAAGGTAAVLTVAGNYLSDGGAIALNTALGDSNSATEKLVVHGDTSGDTVLNISNLGGSGAQTTGNGILVVEVAGASNGVFSLPAPGYLEVGGFRYDLVKTGNNWYLSTSERTEASPVEASMVCTPSQLGSAAGLVATCAVSLNAAQGVDTPINLNLPATSPRYTTTCGSPIVVAANATQASCTITAVPSTSPDDGDVMAELSIAPPTVPDAYAPSGALAQVQILGNGTPRPGAGAHAVPTMGTVGLVAMASLMGMIGLRRSRKHNGPQG
ncbi:hypothetical protein GCM10027276_36740 [Comamonas piscis]